MIIQDGLEFHAAELRRMSGIQGWLPARIPAQIAEQLNERGRFIATDTVATEIRFVTDARNIRLTLSALKPEFGLDQLEVRIYYGDFQFQSYWLKPGVVTTLMFSPPPQLAAIKEEYTRRGPGIGFAPSVCRILSQRGGLIYCGIETFGHALRPPNSSEKPEKTCLFYGSSITNSTLDGYPSVAAQKLGVDFINLGLSGACHVEPLLSDWMASLEDWDFAVFELGINMIEASYDTDVFQERVKYLMEVFTTRHPQKPLVMMMPFPSYFRNEFRERPLEVDRDAAYCQILRELYAQFQSRGNWHLLESSDILDDTCCLGADFLHLKTYGHAAMGLKLAERLKDIGF